MQEPSIGVTVSPIPQTPSPCTKVCALDAAGVCVGCYRTRQEIAGWSRASEAAKQQIVQQTQRRRRLAKKEPFTR